MDEDSSTVESGTMERKRSYDQIARGKCFPSLTAIIVLAALVSAPGASMADGPVYYLHLSPLGEDTNAGTLEAPIHSFQRAEEILEAVSPDSDVIVRLMSDQGAYFNYTVRWSYFHPAHSITFESYPADSPAVFKADLLDPPWEPFFTLEASPGEPTNLVFNRLRVADYVSRVFYFIRDRENSVGGWNGHNIIADCTFRNIGNFRLPSRPIVYGALTFVNSRDNVIDRCAFIHFANANAVISEPDAERFPDISIELRGARTEAAAEASPALPIVGIYLAHHSSRNTIVSCTIDSIFGDPVRMRDASDSTVIDSCVFTRSGHNAICSMWFCEASLFDCDKIHSECPSCFAVLRNSAAFGDRLCSKPRLFADLSPILSRRCPPGCRTAERLRIENTIAEACPP